METKEVLIDAEKKTLIFKNLCLFLIFSTLSLQLIYTFYNEYFGIILLVLLASIFLVICCSPLFYVLYTLSIHKKNTHNIDSQEIRDEIKFVWERKLLIQKRIKLFWDLLDNKIWYDFKRAEDIRIKILSITELIEDLDDKITFLWNNSYHFNKNLERKELAEQKGVFINYLIQYFSLHKNELEKLKESIENQANQTENTDWKVALESQKIRLQSYIESINNLVK